MENTRTVPGIGPGGWDAGKLAADQIKAWDSKAERTANGAILFRLYTEWADNLVELVSRYFGDATIIPTIGIWRGETEDGAVIEIVGTVADLQSVTHLAGDIRHRNEQSAVLVTWGTLSTLMVTE